MFMIFGPAPSSGMLMISPIRPASFRELSDFLQDRIPACHSAAFPVAGLLQFGVHRSSISGKSGQSNVDIFFAHASAQRTCERDGKSKPLTFLCKSRLVTEERVRNHRNTVKDRFVGRIQSVVGHEHIRFLQDLPLIDVIYDAHSRIGECS